MTISLMFADRRVEVAESTIELAEMAYADHGRAAARGVLRELIPTLTLLEACAAVAEAVRRLDERTIKLASLTVEDICDELSQPPGTISSKPLPTRIVSERVRVRHTADQRSYPRVSAWSPSGSTPGNRW